MTKNNLVDLETDRSLSLIVLLGTPETSKHIDPQKNIKEIPPATEDKGAAIEARDLNTCSNNVEAPLSDLESEQETQTFVSSV